MVLYFNIPPHTRASFGLEVWTMHRPTLLCAEIQRFYFFYFRRIGANMDRNLDLLVIETLIPYQEPTIPKALSVR